MVRIQGQLRTVIEHVRPEIDGGRFPIKRVAGDRVVVTADVFADGHDHVACAVLHRREGAAAWSEVAMTPLGNDRWQGEFSVSTVGRYRYTVLAWIDRFGSWQHDLEKRVAAGQNVADDLLIGANLVAEARPGARSKAAERLRRWEDRLRAGAAAANATTGARANASTGARAKAVTAAVAAGLSQELRLAMAAHLPRRFATHYDHELLVTVDPPLARFSAWYELFPRSCSSQPGRHGTLRDCIARLPYIAGMGFDVLYLPPIHPIGMAFRKGRNNAPAADPGEPGSPWAIGGAAGGHLAVHPELGSLDDFRALVRRARDHNLTVALDIAFQCSPDHPYAREHPEWFRRRPDGTIQYAENPPKKYQDIYPFDFESDHWQELWAELKGVFLFWIEQGVSVFRVDNPHTKPMRFWAWVIAEVKSRHPEVLFLSEAFTRPKVMYHLAKAGFTHSYTYFTWRTTRDELQSYFTELTQTAVKEFFRPHLWPNTPDILPLHLQEGGRPAFMARLVLAATLAGNYGIYGPAYELCVNTPLAPGKEEYLDSEKYEIKDWNLDRPDSLRDLITRVNAIRRQNPALQQDAGLRFHDLPDTDHLIGYTRSTVDGANVILVVVNLDPLHTQRGWVELPLADLGLDPDRPFVAHELLTGERYAWRGRRNYVELDPTVLPAHILRLEQP